MLLNTASAVINFYSKLEDRIAEFYDGLASNESFSAGRDTFKALAKENHRHKELMERTYREVITDALEACFAFDIDDRKYLANTDMPIGATYQDAVQKAIGIEELDMRFCLDTSDKSKHLMSDVPQAFSRIAKKKQNRIAELRLLLQPKNAVRNATL